jgi:hypothetical protein
MDLIIALLIVVLAYALGFSVNPLLWVIVTPPALWLVSSHDRRARI